MDFGVSNYIQNNSSIVLDNLETRNQVITSADSTISSDVGIVVIAGINSDATIWLPSLTGINSKRLLVQNSVGDHVIWIRAQDGETIDHKVTFTFDHDIGSITLLADEANTNWIILDTGDTKLDNKLYNTRMMNSSDQYWYKGTVSSHESWLILRDARVLYPLENYNDIVNYYLNYNDRSRRYVVYPNNIITTVNQRGQYDSIVLWAANTDFKDGQLVSTKEWNNGDTNLYRGLCATYDGAYFSLYKSDRSSNSPINQEVMRLSVGTSRSVYFRGINSNSTSDIVNNKLVGVRQSDGKLVKLDRFNHLSFGQLNLCLLNNTNGEVYDASNVAYSTNVDSLRWNALTDKNQFNIANDSNDPPVYLLGVNDFNAFVRVNDIYSSSSGGVSIMMADDGRLFKNSSSIRYKHHLSKYKLKGALPRTPLFKYRYKGEKVPEPVLEESYWSLAPTVESLVDNGLALLVNYKWIKKDTLKPAYCRKYSLDEREFEVTTSTVDPTSESAVPIESTTTMVTKCLVPDSINYNNYIGYINAQTNRLIKDFEDLLYYTSVNNKSIQKLKKRVAKLEQQLNGSKN